MTEKKTTDAQSRATKKWGDKNKDKQRIYRYRSYARKYVRDIAAAEDLHELATMIQTRLDEMEK
ncbi:hypothetical protein [Ligilactobacillus murinus]|uniref:hypothetical protein n=1 Tax=Ligilactobacillus murinus TaxID=1622 RepID=UPI000704B3AF|nr:hypothetical protein [Ligilactobacillus murinus]